MNAIAAICVLLAAPTLDVSIAPDQPVPYVYADEPVILQIKSSEDVDATGSVSITNINGDSVSISLPAIPLRANGAHWQPLDGAPSANGRYRMRIALGVDGSRIDRELVYCRIQRPGNEARAPVRVTVNKPAQSTLHALRGVPLREITLPITTPDIAGVVASAVSDGFQVTIALDAAAVSDIPSIAQLADKLGDGVGAWRVSVPEVGVEALEPLTAALKDAGSRGQLEVVLDSGLSNIDAYLRTGLARSAFKVLLPERKDAPSELPQLRTAFERAGYEGLRIQNILAADFAKNDDNDHWKVTRSIVSMQTPLGTSPEVDVNALYTDDAFGESYTFVSAMAHRLNGYTHFDELPMAQRARAVVFRQCDAWIMVLWAAAQPAVQSIPVGNAVDLVLTDADNNAVTLPEPQDGVLRLPLTGAPIYLSGKGGPILATTARTAAKREADGLAKDKSFPKNLPAEFIELIKPIAAAGFDRIDRVSFFALLRMFPLLEQKWHDGSIPRDVAVPAMASLSRLVRSLCVIEQDSGETFIELMADTIARCGDYQSQYLTSTSGSAEKHERADWLLAEVARLTAEAKQLNDGGCTIEAVGVASLAEWRARSLEFAKNANPLGTPEPARAQPPVETPEQKPARASTKKK